jgi:ribosomal protein S18 acetylase RimI-like enzyme
VDVPPYTKRYGPEEVEPESYLDAPDRVVFFAWLGEEVIGQIRLRRNWNGYAYVDDLAVEPEYRGEGIGRALISRAIEWAKAKGFPGLMLETQDNNVAACRLYARCGFELRGFDTHLYKALDPSTQETALYWYFNF